MSCTGRGPVVLIHWGAGTVWAGPLLGEPVLAGRFRLLTSPRAGFAGSSRVEPGTMATRATHCRLLMRELAIERAHMVGCAVGRCGDTATEASTWPTCKHSGSS